MRIRRYDDQIQSGEFRAGIQIHYPSKGKYQGQRKATGSRVYKDRENR